MLLEKLNEVVWNINRKRHPGRFELRASTLAGKLNKISISLLDDENEKKSVAFEMDKIEFDTFYDIISNFKEMIESPELLNNSPKSRTSPSLEFEENVAPLSLDGNFPKSDEEKAIESTLDSIDISLASLEELDDDKEIIENKVKLIPPTVPNPNTQIPEPAVSIISSTTSSSSTIDSLEDESKLDPKEWDPW